MQQSEFSGNDNARSLAALRTVLRSLEPREKKFTAFLNVLNEMIPFQSASLFICHERTGRLEEVATLGGKVELHEKYHEVNQIGDLPCTKCEPVISCDRETGGKSFRSVISVPLACGGNLFGVLNLARPGPDSFNENHLPLLDIIAGELSGMLDRACMEQKTAEISRELLTARQDIEKLQQQLVDLEKYTFFYDVTSSLNHMINNPLTIILGNLEMIFMKYPDLDESVAGKLHIIRDECFRISTILKKVADAKRKVMKVRPGISENNQDSGIFS